MIKKIEVLVIEIFNKFIGIDCSEIKKIMSNLSLKEKMEFIDKYKKKNKYYKLGEIYKINEGIDYDSIIVIDKDNENDLIISVPVVLNIISIETSNILTIPEYIKKRQDPFFIWGFVEHEEKMISLITFVYLNEKG